MTFVTLFVCKFGGKPWSKACTASGVLVFPALFRIAVFFMSQVGQVAKKECVMGLEACS